MKEVAISVVETPQPNALWQLVTALVFHVDGERNPKFLVRACGADGKEWFVFHVDSREEAQRKKARLEAELAVQGSDEFLRAYSALYRESG